MIHQRPLVIDGGADWLPRRIKRRALSTDTWGYLNAKLLLRHWQLAPGAHILRLPSPDDSQVAVLVVLQLRRQTRRQDFEKRCAVSLLCLGARLAENASLATHSNDAIATEEFYMSFLAGHQNSARGASLTRSATLHTVGIITGPHIPHRAARRSCHYQAAHQTTPTAAMMLPNTRITSGVMTDRSDERSTRSPSRFCSHTTTFLKTSNPTPYLVLVAPDVLPRLRQWRVAQAKLAR